MTVQPIFDDYAGTTRVRTCTLMVTHACNLNCTYCYEEFKGDRYMDRELAVSIVRKEFALVENSDMFDSLQVDFMGGEPLMNFPLIKPKFQQVMMLRIAVSALFYAGFRVGMTEHPAPLTGHSADSSKRLLPQAA